MKLIEGKWYTSLEYSPFDYFKFFELVDGVKCYFNECIKDGKYSKDKDWWYKVQNLKEVSIEEIRQYLPLDHPDLIENIPILMENYDYLIPILEKLNIK